MSVRDRACVNISRVPRARRRPRTSRASVTRGDARASTRKLGSRRARHHRRRARARRATRDRATRDRARPLSRVVSRPRAIASPRDVPSYRTLVRRGKTERGDDARGTTTRATRAGGRCLARVAIGEISQGRSPRITTARIARRRAMSRRVRPTAVGVAASPRGARRRPADTPRANDEKMAGACDVEKGDDASDDARAMGESARRSRWRTRSAAKETATDDDDDDDDDDDGWMDG